jgi:predicted house-cleaning noncanonical NTP pyrophosphatase (MazG superfamily)
VTKFLYRKLVRDLTPDRIKEVWGGTCEYRVLDHDEYAHCLEAKLLEESLECIEEQDPNKMANEFADVYDVLEALAKVREISPEMIAQARARRFKERGVFEKRIWIEYAETPEGTDLYDYCMAHPEKYPKG